MIIDMRHPVIVPRRKRFDHEPAYALATVLSPIEVQEYSADEVAIAALVHHGNGSTTYRRIGRHCYKMLGYMPASALKDGADMARSLVGNEALFDFGAFFRHVIQEAVSLGTSERTLSKNVAYVDRPLNAKEEKSGLRANLKAFDKAPPLKGQSWVGAGHEDQVERWRSRFQDFMENVALVNGIVHVRTFEPCLEMRLSHGTQFMEIGRLNFMEQWLGGPREVDRHGIPYGINDNHLKTCHFSLVEYDFAHNLGKEFGFDKAGYRMTTPKSFTVVDEAALPQDFIREDAYRIAVRVLTASADMSNLVGPLPFTGRGVVSDREECDAVLRSLGDVARTLTDLMAPSMELDDETLAEATSRALETVSSACAYVDRELMKTGGNPAICDIERREIADIGLDLAMLELRRESRPISVPEVGFRAFDG